MKVKVKRKAKASWHPQWQADIKTLADWSAKELSIDTKKISVDFVLKNDNSVQYSGVALTMDPLRRFVIILNSWGLKSEKMLVSTIFHEMTHIAQEFHNGLYISDDLTEATYEGTVYRFEDEEDFQDHYWWLPWEIDARKAEKVLFSKWKKEKNS